MLFLMHQLYVLRPLEQYPPVWHYTSKDVLCSDALYSVCLHLTVSAASQATAAAGISVGSEA